MPSVTKSVDLERPQEEAFALATDPARFDEWLTLHSAWPDGVPPAPEQGAAFKQKLTIMGMPADVDWKVTEFEPGARLVMSGEGPMGATLGTTITADGGTVSYEAEFSGGGIQGPMGDMVAKKAGEEIEASLEKLRAIA